MAKVYNRTYTKLHAITKATVSLKAEGVSNDELALVNGRLAQVVKTKGDIVTLQVFSGTEGMPTDAEVSFLGTPPTLRASEQLSGRFFNADAVRKSEIEILCLINEIIFIVKNIS